ncbi:phosphohistidine phosphatase SixA [Aquifex aeolicus]|uniref:Phosphohistidine phosphatase SixA n=1 Tax=Aquifex aeolicus (strain VF5) TaxID=224324 RepID=O67234_AQUAE|nr:phosphohistidine phosphatase SixA [Aquifex aeolicus]AAC07207.1 hypothetical protein aq_1173 [Aquifex aeolicus VF5]
MFWVFLVRHGEAYPEEVDPQRPLTEKGRKDTEKIAKALKNFGVKPELIYTSPKLRAKQTAKIIANILGVEKIRETELLLPNTDPKETSKLIDGKNVVLCGHLPNLARLFSLLYLSEDNERRVNLSTSGALVLKWKDFWVLELLLEPSVL